MKKFLITLFTVAAICLLGSCKANTGLSLSPSHVTVKVGQEVSLTPTIYGDEFSFNDIVRIVADGHVICDFTNRFTVVGLMAGETKVGIGIPKDKDDPSKGMLYEAYTSVSVVE